MPEMHELLLSPIHAFASIELVPKYAFLDRERIFSAGAKSIPHFIKAR